MMGTRIIMGLGWELDPRVPLGKWEPLQVITPAKNHHSTYVLEGNKTIIILNNNAQKDMIKLVEAAHFFFFSPFFVIIFKNGNKIQLYKILFNTQCRHLKAFKKHF